MKIIIALALFVAVAQAGLQPLKMLFPEDQMFPSHTAAEWRAIYDAQVPQPEVVANYKPGTEPQSDDAGAMRGDAEGRVIQGSNAVAGQFPWQVSNSMDNSYFCGGSIISTRWILTAGHCVSGFSTWTIGAGSLLPISGTSGSVSVTSRTGILHENYNSLFIVNDIGLVELPTPLTFSTTIGAVRLPSRSLIGEDLTGRDVVISGWGRTSDASNSIAATLQTATLQVITNEECAETYGGISVRVSTLCTSGKPGPATCNGDSGGPLVLLESDGKYAEVGIVSFGSSAGCEKGFPDAFTRVTSYLNWIETHSGIIVSNE